MTTKKRLIKKKKEVKEFLKESGLNFAQERFCEEYIFDWNGTRAYKIAYPRVKNNETACVNASRLLTKANILAYIELLKSDLAKVAGISKLMVLQEHQKIAFASMAHLHNTWITRKEFEELSEDQKACIESIESSVEQKNIGGKNKENQKMIEVETVKIKLYNKQKSLDSINTMMGWNEAEKIDHSNKDGSLKPTNYDLSKLSIGTIKELIRAGIISKD